MKSLKWKKSDDISFLSYLVRVFIKSNIRSLVSGVSNILFVYNRNWFFLNKD